MMKFNKPYRELDKFNLILNEFVVSNNLDIIENETESTLELPW